MALPVRKDTPPPQKAVDRTRNVTYAYTSSVKRKPAANDNAYSYPANDNYQVVSNNPGRQTVDESFRKEANARTMSGQPRNVERTMRQEPQYEEEPTARRSSARYSRARKMAKSKTAEKLLGKNKVKATTNLFRAASARSMILAVGSIFAVFQFFIGTAYTVTFAVLGALDEITAQEAGGNYIARLGSYVWKFVADTALEAVQFATGIDIAGLFGIAMGLSIIWTFITLISASAILYLNGYNAMGGKGTTAKQLTWIFVIITSIVPFLSMFPMTLAYVLVVFWKEK